MMLRSIWMVLMFLVVACPSSSARAQLKCYELVKTEKPEKFWKSVVINVSAAFTNKKASERAELTQLRASLLELMSIKTAILALLDVHLEGRASGVSSAVELTRDQLPQAGNRINEILSTLRKQASVGNLFAAEPEYGTIDQLMDQKWRTLCSVTDALSNDNRAAILKARDELSRELNALNDAQNGLGDYIKAGYSGAS